MKTNIQLTKEQYSALVNALQIAGTVYGVMGDMVDDKYKKQSNELDDLEDLVLSHAEEIDFGKLVETFQGRNVLIEENLTKAIDDLDEYEKYSFWDNLGRKLADRDLIRKISREQIKKMTDVDIMEARIPIEESYYKEFDQYGIDRLEISNNKSGN